MFARVKRAVMGRRKTVAIVATLVVAGGTTALAVLPNAEASERLGTGHAPTRQYGDSFGNHKLPLGARRAEGLKKPVVGARAKAFSDRVKSPRIIGGVPANAADHPFIVAIQTFFFLDTTQPPDGIFEEYVATCTGTVIAPNKIMTAGHCDTDFNLGVTFVIAGVNNVSEANSVGFVARVQSTWTHPAFNLAELNDPLSHAAPLDDVSILTLKQPLPQPTYPPVALAPGTATDYNETAALILGYGVTSNDTTAQAGTLYQATVPIHSNATCAANINVPDHGGYDSGRMLCAGTLGTGGDTGVDACHGDSGGPILVNNVQVGITDWGYDPCATNFYGVYERVSNYRAPIDAEVANPGVINPDWSTDGHTDLLARTSAGELIEFSGSGFVDDGFNGFNTQPGFIGTGWNGFTKLFRVMNWDGSQTPSIMARTANGTLYRYRSDGIGGFEPSSPPEKVGSSWNIFTDIMVTNNWTGDGHPNILGRKANGDLFLYTSNGMGGWENGGIGIKIGTAWNQFNTVLTPGDWLGAGHQALIGRNPKGELFLYESDGAGGWLHNGIGIKIGSAWDQFKTFMAVGDWSGDNRVDVIGIQPGGLMKLYTTDGHGNWQPPVSGRQIDTGWNAFTAVF